jgi:hypothetical protein
MRHRTGRASVATVSQDKCHTCGKAFSAYDGIHYGSIETGYRDLCSRCFNGEIALTGGLDFQHVQFEPVDMADAGGQPHRFHFRLHLLGDRVALNAFELRDDGPGGYEFQAIGDAECDLFVLLAEMIARIRRALAYRHLKEDGRFGLGIADLMVRGRITCDAAEGERVLLLVIDGREVTWVEFGRMLMTFEGWQFKLEIRDKSEEV